MQRESLPTSADAIRARMVDFQFNAAILREMRSLAIAKREIDKVCAAVWANSRARSRDSIST